MAREPDERRELKVKIPTRLYMQLVGCKFLRGTTIAETVVAALDAHFARLEAPRSGLP